MSASEAGSESADNGGEATTEPVADAQPDAPTEAGDAPDDVVAVELVEDPEVAMRGRVSDLEARLRTVSAAYNAMQGELAETRARLERQAALKEQMRRGEVVAELFEPVENLRRSLDAMSAGSAADDSLKGLRIVLQQFMEGFKKLGLEEITGKGSRFDPKLHEALSVQPVSDPDLDDVVTEVFSAGYRIGSRLIRPARVVIGQYQEPVGEA